MIEDVSGDKFEWRQAWANARAKREANAPRRAAIREAFEATKPFKARPAEQVRARLPWELAARGVNDLTPRQLDILLEAVTTSPRGTAFREARRYVKAVKELFGEAKAHTIPEWTLTPEGWTRLARRDDEEAVLVKVEADAAATGRYRPAVREIPRQWGTADEPEDELARAFLCWLSAEPTDEPAGTVTVHAGRQVIGHLNAAAAGPVRQMLSAEGAGTLVVEAVVVGDDPETGSIQLYLPNQR